MFGYLSLSQRIGGSSDTGRSGGGLVSCRNCVILTGVWSSTDLSPAHYPTHQERDILGDRQRETERQRERETKDKKDELAKWHLN